MNYFKCKFIKNCFREYILIILTATIISTTSTFKVLCEENIFIIDRLNKTGLGDAYIDGFRWALEKKYDYIFEMDADFSHDPASLPFMLEKLKEKEADVIIGSRYKDGVNVVNWPLSRILLSYFASLYVRLITRMPVKDPTAGFVGYSREVLNSLDLNKIKFIGYAFQIEMKYKSWINGFKLVEYPIIFKNRTRGTSKMDQSIILEAFIGVIRLRFFDRNTK